MGFILRRTGDEPSQTASILQFRKSNKRQPQKKRKKRKKKQKQNTARYEKRRSTRRTMHGPRWHRTRSSGPRTQGITTRLICVAHAARGSYEDETSGAETFFMTLVTDSAAALFLFQDTGFGPSLFAQQMHPMQFSAASPCCNQLLQEPGKTPGAEEGFMRSVRKSISPKKKDSKNKQKKRITKKSQAC